LPVPVDSEYAKTDVETAFEGMDPTNDSYPDAEPDEVLVEKELVNIDAIMDEWDKIGNNVSGDQMVSSVGPPAEVFTTEQASTNKPDSKEVDGNDQSDVILFSDLLNVATDDPVI